MKLTDRGTIPVYTIAGASTARPLPEWLARKRKRSLKKDPEYANRVELLQDFEFEEASSCVRASEDGEWVMSTGTYKPQIHTHYLPHLSLSYARHTNALNQTFVLLSSDYSKSLHLQTDRFLEFHTPSGLHYTTRIPRYGRDLKYNRQTAEALIPAVGINSDGHGEVFRLNLEQGRFMKGYEINVGEDVLDAFGSGAIQGSAQSGSVNCAAIAEESHGLMAFGTSLGTVEFWDSRSRNRISILGPPRNTLLEDSDQSPGITALTYHRSGLNFATGNGSGIVHVYDLRAPTPLLRKDQGYDFAIQNLTYLESRHASTKLLSSDKKGIKIWDAESGDYWAGIEPAVDLSHVEWIPDSGMMLTANEGMQQHAFFIPQLGPAPRWCAFLDNLVEEMAEDAEDPNAFKSAGVSGEVYDNYKFLDMKQLRELSLDHLVGTTNLLRPYMHGYFVAQKLYEQARLLTNPDLIEQQRQKSIQEKIDKERESRIRGTKKVAVKVNRRYAEALAAREDANERRKAERVLRRGGDDDAVPNSPTTAETAPRTTKSSGLGDDRFAKMFENEDFEIDETSREFQLHNPSTSATTTNATATASKLPRGLTAVEQEAIDAAAAHSNPSASDNDSDSEASDAAAAYTSAIQRQRQRADANGEESTSSKNRIGAASYKKSGHKPRSSVSGPAMRVSSSTNRNVRRSKDQAFGEMVAGLPRGGRRDGGGAAGGQAFGEKEITFAPAVKGKRDGGFGGEAGEGESGGSRRGGAGGKERRSASGNVFRRM